MGKLAGDSVALAAWTNSSGILIGLFSAVSAVFALLSPKAIIVLALSLLSMSSMSLNRLEQLL
jgi:hypothetical protein